MQIWERLYRTLPKRAKGPPVTIGMVDEYPPLEPHHDVFSMGQAMEKRARELPEDFVHEGLNYDRERSENEVVITNVQINLKHERKYRSWVSYYDSYYRWLFRWTRLERRCGPGFDGYAYENLVEQLGVLRVKLKVNCPLVRHDTFFEIGHALGAAMKRPGDKFQAKYVFEAAMDDVDASLAILWPRQTFGKKLSFSDFLRMYSCIKWA